MTSVQTSDPHRPKRRRPLVRLAAIAAAAAVAAGGVTIANANADTPPQAAQDWNMVWSDEFDGAAGQLPSSDNWRFNIGHAYPGGPDNWGTGEIAYHTDDPANVSLDGNGNLAITALRDGGGNWTSARIETQRTDFRAPEGGTMRIEGRLRLPDVTGEQALGYWPAFWALGSPFRGDYWNWPGIGEYDIMENVNGLDEVHGVLHCGTAPGGPCNEFNGIGGATDCGGSCHSGYHTYAFEWDDSGSTGELRWYADGAQFHSISEADLPADTWRQMTDHAGYFILLNLAIGGAFPDALAGHATPVAATEPGHSMLVDYVRVFTRGGSGPGPDPDPTTTDPGEPGQGHDAYAPIEAASFDGSSGVSVQNSAVGPVGDGEWVRFDDVDFGSSPPLDFVARVASGAADGVSGLIEVRIDSASATPIGSFALANTGGWEAWRDVPGNVSSVTGVHDVYLTFTSGQPNPFASVDQFQFRR
ncbi:carbohydrate-binding protein [Glycomyces tarimensis]